jgi:predicted amidohydrolase YtcJ
MRKILSLCLLSSILFSCTQKSPADLIIYNATIYTVDSTFSKAEAMAVKDGKIIATGSTDEINKQFEAKESTDANGKFVYPGFIDAHAHFIGYTGYAQSLQNINLFGTKSWDEVIEKVKTFAKLNPEGWLKGRGWDQNDWAIKEFPSKEKLDSLFPDRPILLTRVDGHAAIANQKALDIAAVHPGRTLIGGKIELKNGKLTGLLIDNAIGIVRSKIPALTDEQLLKVVLQAQQNCFAVGLTSIDDCGLDFTEVEKIEKFQQSGGLKMRMYVMLSDAPANYDYIFKRGKIKTERLNVQSFKVYADGALGSRGASLLAPYSDKPGWSGFLLSNPSHFDSVANLIYSKGYQMCTHAIGDSGNRTILNIYAKYLKGKNDLRWRIEHAQVINKNDFSHFGANSIIPSVQPTHATSDMYWAGDRLGSERVKGAYAYQQLLKENGWLPLGTDFPVEDISPFKTFYAAVVRKDANGYPDSGYQIENALSRDEALRGMTIWAAKSNFEEHEKGSLEKGKFADFIILDQDIMTIAGAKILQTKVLGTYINGIKEF